MDGMNFQAFLTSTKIIRAKMFKQQTQKKINCRAYTDKNVKIVKTEIIKNTFYEI